MYQAVVIGLPGRGTIRGIAIRKKQLTAPPANKHKNCPVSAVKCQNRTIPIIHPTPRTRSHFSISKFFPHIFLQRKPQILYTINIRSSFSLQESLDAFRVFNSLTQHLTAGRSLLLLVHSLHALCPGGLFGLAKDDVHQTRHIYSTIFLYLHNK